MQETKTINNTAPASGTDASGEDRFHSIKQLLNNLSALVLSVDKNLKLTYLNLTAAKLLQAQEMVVVEPGTTLNSPDVISCPELADIVQTVINDPRVHTSNIQLVMPLHKLSLHVEASPVFGEQNELTEVALLGQEVDNTAPMIEHVSETLNTWQTLFSNMGFYVWTYYFDSDSVALTSLCQKDLYLPEEINNLIGFDTLLEIIHPDDKKIVSENYRGFLKNPKGLFLEQEYRIRHRKGHYLWVRDKVSIQFNSDNTPVYAVGLFEDITDDIERIQTVERNSSRLRLALDIIGGGLWDYNVKEEIFHIDERHRQILGLEGQDTFSMEFWFSRIHPDDKKHVYRVLTSISAENPQFRYQYRIKGANDRYLTLMTLGRITTCDEKGSPLFTTGVIYDYSPDVAAQESLRLSEERLNLAFETAKEGVWEMYPQEKRSFRSQSYFQLLGYPPSSDSTAFKFTDNVHPDDRKHLIKTLKGLITGDENSDVVRLRMIHNDGHELHIEMRGRVIDRNEDGKATRIVGVAEDISERLHHLSEIEALAFYDPLTQLPNRRLVLERANQALKLEARNKNSVTLMLLDLDKFKEINDTMGHDAGDCVLQELSTRFLTCMRSMDTLGRQGGDEFIVVLPECNKKHAYNVAARLIEQVSDPLNVKGRMIKCGVSIGIASAPENGTTIDELLRNADIAMYRAKNNNDNIAWFDPEYAEQMERRIKLEQDLRNVVNDHALSINYQPRISLETGEIMSLEALVRWQHDELGFVSPAEFIPIAEEADLICDIGQYIIQEVCKQLRLWKETGIETVISINASPDELLKEDYTQRLLETLNKYELTRESVEVELTETAAIGNWEKVISTLNKLHGEGIIISLDDWGTGYSSLSYLTQLPAHYVKLDRSFIEDLHHSDPKKNTQLLLKGMTGLTQSLGFELVAEGIETLEQARSVKDLGCLQGQGYLFSRPLPASELTELLSTKVIPLQF